MQTVIVNTASEKTFVKETSYLSAWSWKLSLFVLLLVLGLFAAYLALKASAIFAFYEDVRQQFELLKQLLNDLKYWQGVSLNTPSKYRLA